MALYPCPVCQTDVSADAASCPKCGDPLDGLNAKLKFVSYYRDSIPWWEKYIVMALLAMIGQDKKRGFYVSLNHQRGVLYNHYWSADIKLRPGPREFMVWRWNRVTRYSSWTIPVEPGSKLSFRILEERSLSDKPFMLIERWGRKMELELIVDGCSEESLGSYLAKNPDVVVDREVSRIYGSRS